MKDFWEWFQHKTGFNEFHWMNHNRENAKQNLVGHMIEFCIINFIEFKVDYSDMLKRTMLSSTEEVNSVYSYFERKINERNEHRKSGD